MITHLLFILICCLIIWKASDGFEVASEYIGRNLTDGVRGATINAIGSSMPELFTTLWFLFVLQDRDGFAGGIGTTAGSAIFNGMIIPAVVILAVIGYGITKSVNVSKRVILRDGLSLIVAEAILIFLIGGTKLEWWHGLVLMLMYGVYATILLSTMSKNTESEDEEAEDEDSEEEEEKKGTILMRMLTLDLASLIIKKKINNTNAWVLLTLSMFIIGGSCALLVHSCEGLANNLGINTYFVAVILASAATSVPDTILSYRDAMNGEYDDAVANALGSNIFDVCFALGFPLFIYTLVYGPISMSTATLENITELRVILLVSTIIAFFIYYIGKGLAKIKAILLLLIYILFTTYIAAKAYGAEWAITLGEYIRTLSN